MNEFSVAILSGIVLFVVTSFVSLAVWAINARIKNAQLEQEKAMLQLEAKITREHIEPALGAFREMVQHLEERIDLLREVRDGFSEVKAAVAKREVIRPTAS